MKRRLSLYGQSFPRRDFLELVAAATVSVAAGACNREREKLVPYERHPPNLVPGISQSYATTIVRDGFAIGVIADSREGKPIKVEGNREHPASMGATGPMEQALLMQLYDPGRPRTVGRNGSPDAWRSFLRWAETAAAKLAAGRGAGLHFLLEPTSSPVIAELKNRVLARFPEAKFHFYAPLANESAAAATLELFGRAVDTSYDLRTADIVVSLDADFLGVDPDRLRYAREFADRRDPKRGSMNRLYVAEAPLTLTGMMADHRLAIRSGEVQDVALGILAELLSLPTVRAASSLRALGDVLSQATARLSRAGQLRWVHAVARDLERARGRCVVMAGFRQPPHVHVFAQAINLILDNVGKTVRYHEPVLLDALSGARGLKALMGAIDDGQVSTLVTGAFDPVYSAPADLDFAARLAKVGTTVYHGLYYDKTAAASTWFIPAAHDFESWGDARAPDGTISLQQPLIEPLFGGVTISEVLAAFLGEGGVDDREILHSFWKQRLARSDFESFWFEHLRKGLIEDTVVPSIDVSPNWERVAALVRAAAAPAPFGGLELNFVPSLTVHDGRYVDVGWLLELPDPITKLTWDNAAIFSPATAKSLSIETGSVIELQHQGRTLRVPVFVLPMQADNTVSLALGFGRELPGSRRAAVGVDAYRLRTFDSLWFTNAIEVTRTGDTYPLASGQPHSTQEGRPLALETTIDHLRRDPRFLEERRDDLPTLYDPFRYPGYRWGMSIDLTRCIGCAACVVACEAENNSPVIGKHEVEVGRQMQWLRIDRYFMEEEQTTRAITQPVMCVHCENAPCEYVCPVNATVHSPEGVNEMIYNRCVGTRFCSNNCPYKVRRFNYFAYQKNVGEVEAMRLNPEVTVRSRGVMEKCTYCIQRIERTRIRAEIAHRPIRDGEVVTACAQACPTEAIVFGSINDPDATVTRLRGSERSYALLHELGTRPNTAHMVRVRNPNPELV